MGAVTKKDEKEIRKILENLHGEIDNKKDFSVSGLCILLNYIEEKVTKATHENMRLMMSDRLWNIQKSLEKEVTNINKLHVSLL